MGTLTARFWEYISEHPEADGQEIAAALDADYGIIRAYICKYRKAGSLVDVEENGVHRWEINPEKMARPRERKNPPVEDFKREMLRNMCEVYYEDFQAAELYTERVEIGKMICRILEKL